MAIYREVADKLAEAGIPVDAYEEVINLLRDDEDLEDEVWQLEPPAFFQGAVLYLNAAGMLPSHLSDWARTFGADHIEPEIEAPADESTDY